MSIFNLTSKLQIKSDTLVTLFLFFLVGLQAKSISLLSPFPSQFCIPSWLQTFGTLEALTVATRSLPFPTEPERGSPPPSTPRSNMRMPSGNSTNFKTATVFFLSVESFQDTFHCLFEAIVFLRSDVTTLFNPPCDYA